MFAKQCVLAFVAICMAGTFEASEVAKRRTWTSADGRFTVDAAFISMTGGQVTLERIGDGQQITVKMERLSQDDQAFIRNREWLSQPKSPPSEIESDPEPHPEPAPEPEPLERWDGFRGIRWATHLDDLPDMTYHVRREGYQRYRPKGRMRIGGAELASIVYSFYDGRFFSVFIVTRGFRNWGPFRDAVFARYGPGSRPNRFRDEWFWLKDGDVHMTLGYNQVSEEASLLITYIPIRNQMKVDSEHRAQEAAERDF